MERFLRARARFHFASSLSMATLGTAITVRKSWSNFWNWSGESHLAAMSSGIEMGLDSVAFIVPMVTRLRGGGLWPITALNKLYALRTGLPGLGPLAFPVLPVVVLIQTPQSTQYMMFHL